MDGEDSTAPDLTEQLAAGPVLAATYGEALSTLRDTWRAGVFTSSLAVIGSFMLVVYIVLITAAASFGGVLVIASARTPPAYGLLVVALSAVLYVVFATVGVVAYAVLVAPGVQAMFRAHARYLSDEVELTFADGVRGGMSSWSLSAFLVVAALLEIVGYTVFFVPGVVISAALSLVVPAMVVHGLSLRAALRRSLSHFIEAPMWHLALALADGAVVLGVGSALPVIGVLITLPLSAQLNLRAYLVAFPRDSGLDGSTRT